MHESNLSQFKANYKQENIKATDLNQYHKISLNAKRILFMRGSKLIRKYEP